jgi:hypothetical protein
MPHISAKKSYVALAAGALVIGTLLSLGTIVIRNVAAADGDCRITSGTVPIAKLTLD